MNNDNSGHIDVMGSNFFQNASLCAKCSCKCCKKLPGAAYPDDFADINDVRIAIESGRWAIDWWEGDPGDGDDRQAYYVRPATKDKIGVTYDPTWGGHCVFHGDKGCDLEPCVRPRECKDLEPKKDFDCEMHNGTGKNGAALAWRDHFEMLNSF